MKTHPFDINICGSLSAWLIAFLAFTVMVTACGDDQKDKKSTLSDDVKNESVRRFIEESESNDMEDEDSKEVSIEEKTAIKAIKAKRVEIISKEIEGSEFKRYSDAELIEYLNGELTKYQSSCDTAVLNRVMNQLNADAVMKTFKSNQVEFSREYLRRLKGAMMACKE